MSKITLLWTLSLTLLIYGCGSSPTTNYYLLTAQSPASPSGTAPSLGVGPIQTPEYLNRNGIVYKREGNQLQVASYDSWAEPLKNGITRVLTLNLASKLDTQDVRQFPWHPEHAPDYGVRLNLFTLDANNTDATLSAEWLVYRPDSAEPVQRRISKLRVSLATAEPRAEQVVIAYSALLGQLSDIIAQVIAQDQASREGTAAPPA